MPDVRLSSQPKRLLNAVVVSSDLMQKTVKVRVGKKEFNKLVGKHFNRDQHLLVRDPASSLRTGDIIEIEPGWRVSKHVRHVVTRILSPYGTRIDERPPVPSAEERIREYKLTKILKNARKRAREEQLVDEDGKPILRLGDGTPILMGEDGKPVGLMRLLEERKVDWTGKREPERKREEVKVLEGGN